MPADFQAVHVLAQMIGVVDHPAREPQDLALKRGKHLERIGSCRTYFFCRRHWAPRPGQCLSFARFVLLAGDSRTALQAGGSAESIIGFAGLPGSPIDGRRTLSVNQRSSSLEPQPSSPGTAACALQFG